MADYLGQGPLMRPFYSSLGSAQNGLAMVSSGPNAELYYSTRFGTRDDPSYFLITKDKLLIEFGDTGMIRAITKKEGRKLDAILERDGQNNFVVHRKNLPVGNLQSLQSYSDHQIQAQLIDYAYSEAKNLPDDSRGTVKRNFKDFTGDRILARFKDFRLMVGPSDIIPDGDSDYHVPIVTTMQGCAYDCGHCTIGGGMLIYPESEIRDNIQRAKQVLQEYHKKNGEDMIEGFINASDILWHLISPKSELSPLEIVALYKEAFPQVSKLGTFFGIRNTIRAVEKIDKNYLRRLFDDEEGITRAYVGVETGHDEAAVLLNKPETSQDKLKAVNYLKDARIAVKAIVQVGVFGEGFYRREEDIGKPKTPEYFVSWKEIADRTVDLLIEMAPYRIMPSEFLPLKNLPVLRLFEQGRIVPYSSREGIEREKSYIYHKIKRAHDKGSVAWQGETLRNRSFEPPYEPDYEAFVKGRRRVGRKGLLKAA